MALSLGTLNISIKTLYVRLVAAEPAFSSAIIRCPNVDIDLINIKMTARQLQLFDSDLKQRATFYEQLSTFIYDSLQSASSRKLLDGERGVPEFLKIDVEFFLRCGYGGKVRIERSQVVDWLTKHRTASNYGSLGGAGGIQT